MHALGPPSSSLSRLVCLDPGKLLGPMGQNWRFAGSLPLIVCQLSTGSGTSGFEVGAVVTLAELVSSRPLQGFGGIEKRRS